MIRFILTPTLGNLIGIIPLSVYWLWHGYSLMLLAVIAVLTILVANVIIYWLLPRRDVRGGRAKTYEVRR